MQYRRRTDRGKRVVRRVGVQRDEVEVPGMSTSSTTSPTIRARTDPDGNPPRPRRKARRGRSDSRAPGILRDQCTDRPQADHFAVLSLFQHALVVSLLGVFGRGGRRRRRDELLGCCAGRDLAALRRLSTRWSTPRPQGSRGRRYRGALWSASGCVGAFARAMNPSTGSRATVLETQAVMLLLTAVIWSHLHRRLLLVIMDRSPLGGRPHRIG